MTILYLCTLCFCMAGIHLDVVGSDMCDAGWVYESNTKICLRTFSDVKRIYFMIDDNDLCRDRTGGEFRNISGQVVEFTEAIEPFLRNYLQFMKVPAAGVRLSSSWLKNFYFTYNPRCDFLEDVRTYFVPGRPVPFQRFWGNAPIICQVRAGPDEPPACPRDVELVTVSDRNATLSWSPGQMGRKVVVYVTVEICDAPSSCRDFANKTFQDVSLFELMNYTVVGLQPNTMYKLALQIQNNTLEKKDCNVTISLTTNEALPQFHQMCTQTNEESSAAVVGLAVMFSISLIACSMMAILLFRNHRQAQKDKNSDIDKIVARVMKQTTSTEETKLQEHKTPETNSALYLNVQVETHEYDKTIENPDDHIYEVEG